MAEIRKITRKLSQWYFLLLVTLQMKRHLREKKTVREWLDFSRSFPKNRFVPGRFLGPFAIASIQIDSEIEALLQTVRQIHPGRVLEIGTARGGTLFLSARIAKPDATLISVDLPEGIDGSGVPKWKIPLFKAFATQQQRIDVLRGDSHRWGTFEKVRSLLDGQEIDFLFIDGDHSYEGVARDFAMYSPLVREGGLVAFHDIVQDFSSRYGIRTSSYSGEVYRFWNEIKARFPSWELVENSQQDGFGIGVLKMRKAIEV